MAFSTWFRDGILNHFRGTPLPAFGANLYLALHSADAGADDAATELTIGTGGYARIPIAVSAGAWSVPAYSGGRRTITNTGTLVGGTATADLNGGVAIQYVTLRTDATGGSQVANGVLGTPKIILTGEQITFPPGTVQLFV